MTQACLQYLPHLLDSQTQQQQQQSASRETWSIWENDKLGNIYEKSDAWIILLSWNHFGQDESLSTRRLGNFSEQKKETNLSDFVLMLLVIEAAKGPVSSVSNDKIVVATLW